jgi:hypothetical protein
MIDVNVFKPILEGLMGQWGVLAQVVMVMGVARAVMKPLCIAAKAVAAATPSAKDDELVAKLEASRVARAIVFVLDYIFSLKLPVKKA